jgi:pyruvate, water dikinase
MSTNTQVTAYVSDISTLRLSDAEEAGGKGANMGELVAASLSVPPGFVLMRSSYLASMQAGGVDVELAALHRETLTQVDNSARVDVTD